jgi:hypothetical protein
MHIGSVSVLYCGWNVCVGLKALDSVPVLQ